MNISNDAPWPENRMDNIGSNGNNGEHYQCQNANAILNNAADHLAQRAITYDQAGGERSMGATVEAFQSITGHSLTEEQGWLFMQVLKAVRSQQGGYRADNYEDAAAYAALAGESASKSRQ